MLAFSAERSASSQVDNNLRMKGCGFWRQRRPMLEMRCVFISLWFKGERSRELGFFLKYSKKKDKTRSVSKPRGIRGQPKPRTGKGETPGEKVFDRYPGLREG